MWTETYTRVVQSQFWSVLWDSWCWFEQALIPILYIVVQTAVLSIYHALPVVHRFAAKKFEVMGLIASNNSSPLSQNQSKCQCNKHDTIARYVIGSQDTTPVSLSSDGRKRRIAPSPPPSRSLARLRYIARVFRFVCDPSFVFHCTPHLCSLYCHFYRPSVRKWAFVFAHFTPLPWARTAPHRACNWQATLQPSNTFGQLGSGKRCVNTIKILIRCWKRQPGRRKCWMHTHAQAHNALRGKPEPVPLLCQASWNDPRHNVTASRRGRSSFAFREFRNPTIVTVRYALGTRATTMTR